MKNNNDIFQYLVDIESIDIKSERYIYEGRPVPRVTEILSKMLSKDFLLYWANSLGFKGYGYKATVERAADIGSRVHDSIEKFLIEGNVDLSETPSDIEFEVINGFESFLSWYKNLKSRYEKVEVIGMEQKLVSPYYGGTYDLLININGGIYLVDFKTSNHIGYEYYMQASVYKMMLEQQFGYNIAGIIILQVSKKEVKYDEYFLLSSNQEHVEYMNNCINTFHGLVYSYYNRLRLEQGFNNVKLKNYILEGYNV